MNTKKELEQSIISLTNIIHNDFPELSTFINEIPASNSTDEGLTLINLKDYYQTLKNILLEYSKTHKSSDAQKDLAEALFPGYAAYPPSEDIFIKGIKVKNINPENLSQNKAVNEKSGSLNEKDFNEDMSGDDLDVPGTELDDSQESIGSEDEENNYYSLGGDNHDN